MPSPYVILGVPVDADDATLRARYLTLIREFPPENHPEQFARMRSAYEKIQTAARRAERHVLSAQADDTLEELIEEQLKSLPRHRLKLDELFALNTEGTT